VSPDWTRPSTIPAACVRNVALSPFGMVKAAWVFAGASEVMAAPRRPLVRRLLHRARVLAEAELAVVVPSP